jgi:ankyrin repeat protein
LYYAPNNEIAELLITRGADVNAIDERGWSPLHAAAMGGEETIEFLIANGANVNAKIASGSYKGMTPLDLASKAEIVDLIRKLGGESGK